jgi:serine/threonine protein kinase
VILGGVATAPGRGGPRGEPLGIIHRDVSPSNILCSAQGEVKLSDFGIAKAATYSSAFYRVRGKVGYMSPEQARTQPIDHRSDLFSLAVCIYESLRGERLYTGDLQTPADVIYAQPIPSLADKWPQLAGRPQIEAVLRRGLSQRSEERFSDAAAFSQALRHVAAQFGLVYSGPELSAELATLLGPDPDKWLSEDSAVSVVTQSVNEPRQLEGKEAASIGALDPARPSREVPVDEPPQPHTVPLRAPISPFAPAVAPRRRKLVWASAAALLALVVAISLLSASDGDPLSAVMRSLRHRIALWTE